VLNQPSFKKVATLRRISNLTVSAKAGLTADTDGTFSPGGNDLTVEVLRMAISGPTATPEVPGFSRLYVAGGELIGMHSVIPYDGRTLAWKVFCCTARDGKSHRQVGNHAQIGRICSSRVCEELDLFLRFENELVHRRCGVAFFSSNAQKMLGSGSK
jgi:hypothetical protein